MVEGEGSPVDSEGRNAEKTASAQAMALQELQFGDLGSRGPDIDDIPAEDLRQELRRLQLRLAAVRRQRDERLAQIQVLTAGPGTEHDDWQSRALAAEAQLAAVYATKTMRTMRLPRRVYGLLLARRPRGAGGPAPSTVR